ncbi:MULTISPECIES: GAF domain-containing protein [Pseudanabaena]|uniref:Circadian input-output histidine kinase CikA n=2 Tax=Pseudanabaena TaxID=1152 RepID=L8MX60_9CYAN|nr:MULTISPECIES: GAF domain-containing protein [Pseudanabaena]ELS32582.1 multi-sensor hybrid histidine kinase [Pseudanabaena biceps PCC 7429]MDG3495176.1 GAF domain-containing protein [Pseudanabaena catenata USMAC16]
MSVAKLNASELSSAIIRPPVVVAAHTTVMEAIAQMLGGGFDTSVQSAPNDRHNDRHNDCQESTSSYVIAIAEDGRAIGILTERDVMRLSFQQADFTRLQIHEVMTCPLVTLYEADFCDISLAVQLFQQHSIRHLPILDYRDRPVGIVTAESLQHFLQQHQQNSAAELTAKNIAREQLIAQIADHIRLSFNLQEVLDSCVQEVRNFLQCDRVVVYQFQSDWSGFIISESVESPFVISLGNHIQDSCFQSQAKQRYDHDQPIIVNNIYNAGYAPCHIEVLEQYQVKANIVIPLQVSGNLWGLLIGHQCREHRDWQPEDASLLRNIAIHLAIAIQQLYAYEQAQKELTERQRSEALIQQQLAELTEWYYRYEAAEKASGQMLYEYDLSSKSLIWGANIARVLGFTVSESPKNLSDLLSAIHPEDRNHFFQTAEICRTNQTPFFCQYRLKHQEGYYIWVEDRNQWLFDDRGEAKRLIGMIADISDRKNAEINLKISEAHHRALIKAIPDLFMRIDRSGIYLEFVCIPSQHRIIGHLLDMNGVHVSETIPPELAQRRMEYIELALQTQSLQIYEQDFSTPEIDHIEEVRVVPYHENEVLLLVRDISDRKKAERELKHTEKLFREAQRIAKIGNWELNLTNQVLYWSDEIFRISEIDPQQFSASYETFLNTVHPEDREMVDRAYQQSVSDRLPYNIVHRLLLPDGRIKYIQNQGETIYAEDGSPKLSQGTIQDITSLKQTELELENLNDQLEARMLERETRYWALMNGASDAIMLADLQGNILEVNMQAEQILGYSRAELTSMHFTQLHPEEELTRTRDAFESLTHQQKIQVYDIIFITKNGQLIPFDVSASVIDIQGEPILQGIFRDIRDRKQIESDLQESRDRSQQKASQETILRKITQRIRQSLNLQVIFDTACHEIRQILQADRVGIFQFDADTNYSDGEFVAESTVEGFSSVLAIRLQDYCFGDSYSFSYSQGRCQIVDDIYQTDLEKCHTCILEQFQVRANLVIPLLCGEALWGLLCIHQCSAPRHWQNFEIELSQQIANQLGIAIYQASLYQQAQSELLIRQKAEVAISQQLRQQQTIGAITQKIRESLDINAILSTVTRQVKEVLNCDRVIVFRLFSYGDSQIVEEAVSPEFTSLKSLHWENELWSPAILDYYWQGKPRIVPDVMVDVWTDCLIPYSIEGQIKSKIVAPILQDLGNIERSRWISPLANNKLWGVLVVHACAEKRVWQDSEAQLLQQIANQLAIAIQQASLFAQVQQELSDRQQAQQQLTATNRKLALSNQELERATRLKDEFLANMSHELRTPLNAILGITEGLQEEVFGVLNAKQKQVLLAVERSGNHLLDLINDILDLAKIEAGKVTLDRSLTNIEQLSQSSLMFVMQQALQKNIQLHIQVEKSLPDLKIDERRIRQVLINLLNNAVKFTLENGRVVLEVTLHKVNDSNLQDVTHWVRFAVIDTGIGITPHALQTLFQPFIQVDSALNRQYEGTGLGLALVKRIVEMHGGQVKATSDFGVGSCFTIELPYNERDSSLLLKHSNSFPSDFVPEPDAKDSQLGHPLILIAEDNEANIITFSSYLSANGYRVIVAKDGQTAVDLVQSEHPDLVLMDIQMPGMDGLKAIEYIRQHQLSNAPIIAVTALAMVGDRERCLAAGANDYLSKPVKLKKLAEVVQQFLHPPC